MGKTKQGELLAGAPSGNNEIVKGVGQWNRLSPAVPTEVLDSYWTLAYERQEVFFRRLRGQAEPWTDNPIVAEYKFTNAYRASDRVSQFLIRNVIYRPDLPQSSVEVLFRILLFKFFNKIETWELLEGELGPLTWRDFQFDKYDRVLGGARKEGKRIYSAAYIMPPGSGAFGFPEKHRNHLRLLEMIVKSDAADKLSGMTKMQQAFDLFRSYPTLGDFLAYQFVTDVNYSELTSFSEMEFVIPGPGARDGLRKCFSDPGGLTEPELIWLMADVQNREFERLGFSFKDLWGRPLQLIDCQNLFCETDKYARVAHPEVAGLSGRTRIKQRFAPKAMPLTTWYPPKWQINENMTTWVNAQIGKMNEPERIPTGSKEDSLFSELG